MFLVAVIIMVSPSRTNTEREIRDINRKENQLVDIKIKPDLLELSDDETLIAFKSEALNAVRYFQHQCELFEREIMARLKYGVIPLSSQQCDAFNKEHSIKRYEYNIIEGIEDIHVYPETSESRVGSRESFYTEGCGSCDGDYNHTVLSYAVFDKTGYLLGEYTRTELAAFINDKY